MKINTYTCPCCGYITFSRWPGSYDICPICFWEDDQVQILDPWYAGGANRPSLSEAQNNFKLLGACEQRFKSSVRAITTADQRDPEWRPVEERDWVGVRTPRDLTETEWTDLKVWYYWKRRVT